MIMIHVTCNDMRSSSTRCHLTLQAAEQLAKSLTAQHTLADAKVRLHALRCCPSRSIAHSLNHTRCPSHSLPITLSAHHWSQSDVLQAREASREAAAAQKQEEENQRRQVSQGCPGCPMFSTPGVSHAHPRVPLHSPDPWCEVQLAAQEQERREVARAQEAEAVAERIFRPLC